MILLVTGGQTFKDEAMVASAMHKVFCTYPISAMIHGDAPGADRLAEAYCKRELPDVFLIAVPARWNLQGNVAGPIRNTLMRDLALFMSPSGPKEIVLLAFPGNNGTKDMKSKCAQRGILVIEAAQLVNP